MAVVIVFINALNYGLADTLQIPRPVATQSHIQNVLGGHAKNLILLLCILTGLFVRSVERVLLALRILQVAKQLIGLATHSSVSAVYLGLAVTMVTVAG